MGMVLLYKGLQFIHEGILQPHSLSAKWSSTFGGKEKAATIWIAIGLLIGFFKGRFVLIKTVQRMVARIASLPLPIRYKDVYPLSYYFLIGGMMGLGLLFRFLPIPIDLRGMIDLAIGSALVNGSMLYFRAARFYDKSSPSRSL